MVVIKFIEEKDNLRSAKYQLRAKCKRQKTSTAADEEIFISCCEKVSAR